MISLRERSLLRLVFHRGASQQELAGVLGISRTHLRRILERAVDRATDPMQQALVGLWRLLTAEEQRLAYLHRVLGLSLRNIAEQGLMEAPPASRSGGKLGSSALRARMRTIERKVRRAAIETRPHDHGLDAPG